MKNTADVYRKAAEIIVRDGKSEHGLVGGTLVEEDTTVDYGEAIKDRSYPVCALGACARAEWELYGTLPEDAYDYDFLTQAPDGVRRHMIWQINDAYPTSAEDIALLLKHRAAEVEGG